MVVNHLIIQNFHCEGSAVLCLKRKECMILHHAMLPRENTIIYAYGDHYT
jgi:hypothetical protein